MKIVFVGGGTGGHFYPLIAVAEEVNRYARENRLVNPKLYYVAPEPYDEKSLYKVGMQYIYCPAGKIRRTRDVMAHIQNFFSMFQVFFGVVKAIGILYRILPDVVFSKGGYASFPVLRAARLLRIPVVIHESDARFGRVNKWSSNFAAHIAIAYPDVEEQLTKAQKEKTALVGVPIRRSLLHNPLAGAHDSLKLKEGVPTILVLGGSTGAQYINDSIIDALPVLLKKYQIFHQVGKKNIKQVRSETKSFLRGLELNRYVAVDYLDEYTMRALYTVADVIITRAGSGTLFEIAEWGIPAVVIPIPEEVSHDQVRNAYAYARETGATVIEQNNLSPHLLISQIEGILENERRKEALQKQAVSFARKNASAKLASLLIRILKSHTK